MDTCSHINLSVIVPVFNASQYLHACIDSILVVDRQDMELILVDDGSTDNSGYICDKYADKDKRVIAFHKQNGGVSSARNLGLKNARGNWITFVDADDKATETLLNFTPDDDVDLVCFNWEYTTGERENEDLKEGVYKDYELKTFLSKHLVDYIFRTPWAKLFRINIISQHDITFNEAFKIGEDNLFMLDFLRYCNLLTTHNESGYIYLQPPKGKYPLPFNKAAEFMSIFVEKYQRLKVDCQPLLLLIELYSFMSLQDDRLVTRIKWEQLTAIRYIQKVCWLHYGMKEKIKILTRRMFSLDIR